MSVQPNFQPPGSPSSLSLVKPAIPKFEGMAVEAANTKITGSAPLTDENVILSIDDRVRMVGEYRVVGVRFEVDPKSGDTVRTQMLKPIELSLCPWDMTDPTDNGIVHARPGHP